jgi:hypothetical protein
MATGIRVDGEGGGEFRSKEATGHVGKGGLGCDRLVMYMHSISQSVATETSKQYHTMLSSNGTSKQNRQKCDNL